MPAAKPQRPAARPRQVAPVSGDVSAFTMRQVAQTAQRAADQLRDRQVITRDLAIGDTVITHGLGRAPTGATITPTVANASWAWALKATSQTQITITCIGVAQPGAILEVF
jgi:hypothetical protein